MASPFTHVAIEPAETQCSQPDKISVVGDWTYEFMNLAFNMVTAGGGKSGVYNYVVRMAMDFPRTYPNDKFTLFVTHDLVEACDPALPNVEIVVCHFASKSTANRMLWEQFYLPFEIKKRKIDVVYTFSVTDIFMSPCPTIIRVGNMLPYSDEALRFQTRYKAKLRLHYLRIMFRISLFTADAALVMSEAAAGILMEQDAFSSGKIIGIDRGVTLESIKKDSSDIPGLPKEYILVVSHIQEHKRFEEIIKGYALADCKIPLLIVGAHSNRSFLYRLHILVESLRLEKRVIFIGRVEHTKLYSFIKPAKIVIFPSMVETYPSSLLEPMLVGAAMIVSDRGVMPAFCGDAVLYYDATSPKSLAIQLACYLDSDDLICTMRARLKEHMKKLDTSWQTAIEKRYQLFRRIVHENK